MAGIVYGAPYVPPSAPVDQFDALMMTWTGWDGSVWDLTDPSAGVFLRKEGVEGLGSPEWQHWTKKSPAIAGQRHTGSIAQERKVFWPVFLYHDSSSMDWVYLDRAFWHSLDPDMPGTWTVSLPDGSSRYLPCRFESTTDSYVLDPVRHGWASYGISLTADDTFWRGPTVSQSWTNATPRSFFNAPGRATPFQITSASTMATAAIPNPGDEDAWPVWTIVGPATLATVGVGSSVVSIPFEIPDGKAVVVDTDPTEQLALYGDWDGARVTNAVDRTVDLGSASFAPIPRGTSVPLNISLTGSGYIRADINPRYRRAW
ncbi:hypothetical protein [Arthrobacter sp. NPDC090010]|uniref:hypothetical protein n=1 Tax=Arthrobacter sp. NPDC090010 TaxID=3363942 RepID=UPI0037F13C79